MSDPVALAGTIGTWVAVFIAIVALAGVLPVYILYKKSKTIKSQALVMINDPNHIFVSASFRIFGIQLGQAINKVLDLRHPPNLTSLRENLALPQWKTLDKLRSTTSWINFAEIMKATFPTVKMVDGNDLIGFKGRESLLPVQSTWILILGVLHWYAIRSDYGLPLGAVPTTRARDHRHCLSGLSGIFYRPSTGLNVANYDDYDMGYQIPFEMRSFKDIQQCLNSKELIPTQTLILLFLGYVRMPNGEHLIVHIPGRTNERFHSRISDRDETFRDRLRICTIVNSEVPRAHWCWMRMRSCDLISTFPT